MKKPKNILLIIGMLFISISAKTQVSDSIYFERLYHTCKVWGHVKYFHTQVATGNVNWDDTLLTYLPGIKTAPTNAAFNDTLLTMVESIGEMYASQSSLPSVIDSLSNNDFTWIEDTIFSDEVKASMDTILSRFRPRSHALVDEYFHQGNPDFEMDDSYYEESEYPSEKKRILAIFRYWNIIDKFYPYKYIMDENWDLVLKTHLPNIINSTDSLSYSLAFKQFTSNLDDSHSSFLSPSFNSWIGSSYTPFFAQTIDNSLVIRKTIENSMFEPGDVIEELDGIDITTYRDSMAQYSHGSNQPRIDYNTNYFIQLGTEGTFEATVNNGQESISKTGERNDANYSEIHSPNAPSWIDSANNEGCIFRIVNMGLLKNYEIPTMMSDINTVDAIIFDIRNYPNNTVWTLVNYFYPSSINIANFTRGDITYPGNFKWKKEYIGNGTNNPYNGEIIILFDERTLSQAEYTIMGLEQFPNSVKIGSQTSGADGNVSKIFLPGKILTYATMLGAYYPDYTETQRIGIVPDYEVRPTIEGIRNGNDEVLDFAMSCEFVNIDEMVKVKSTSELQLYPNPANNTLHFNLINAQASTVEIINLQGKPILHEKVNSKSGSVDVSSIDEGLYIIKLNTNQGVITQTFLKN
jgi:carboxyl-terminal processing protease